MELIFFFFLRLLWPWLIQTFNYILPGKWAGKESRPPKVNYNHNQKNLACPVWSQLGLELTVHHGGYKPILVGLVKSTDNRQFLVYKPSESIEPTEDIRYSLVLLCRGHLTLPTLHQFWCHLAARSVLDEGLTGLLQNWHRGSHQRLGECCALLSCNTQDNGITISWNYSTIQAPNCGLF